MMESRDGYPGELATVMAAGEARAWPAPRTHHSLRPAGAAASGPAPFSGLVSQEDKIRTHGLFSPWCSCSTGFPAPAITCTHSVGPTQASVRTHVPTPSVTPVGVSCPSSSCLRRPFLVTNRPWSLLCCLLCPPQRPTASVLHKPQPEGKTCGGLDSRSLSFR